MGTRLGLALLIGMAAVIMPHARAEEAVPPEDKRQVIQELLEVTDAEKMAGSITEAMLQQMERSYPQMVAQLLPEVRQAADQQALRQKLIDSRTRFSKRFRELYLQRIDFGQIVEQIYVPLYDKHFSEQELKDLVAFYRSPSGKKALATMPDLLKESMQRSSEVLNPQIMQIVRDIMEEEKSQLIEPAAPAAPTTPATPPADPDAASQEPVKAQ